MSGAGVVEEWRPVGDCPGYEVSNLGRVRSWRGKSNGRIMNGDFVKGYRRVTLQRTGQKPAHRRVHRLVTTAFLGPRPAGMVTRHLNGIQTDNRLVNLQYGTQSENALDTVRHGNNLNTQVTECPQGHPYDEANTVWLNGGTRRNCRTCHSLSARRRRARLREQVAS